MSPTRRTPPPRKRPAAAPATNRVVTAGREPEQVERQGAPADPIGLDLDDLASQFDALLRADSSIDNDTRQSLSEHFRSALDEARVDGGADLAEWKGTALDYADVDNETESAELTRRLDEALKPLQARETQIALEFSRRLQSDGQEEALAWLRQQQAQEEPGSQTIPTADDHPRALRTEVVGSRSRRLRGPPAR